jgi:hypothetical protein
MGSLAEGENSWYWQDGIGPNVSGLMHGITGWGGAMGIVTRMSHKLYPISEGTLEPEGISYDSCVKLTDRMKWINVAFSAEKDVERTLSEMTRAGIGFVVNRVPSLWRDIAKSRGDLAFRNQFWKSWGKRSRDDVEGRRILRVLLVGRASRAQLEWEEHVFMDLVAKYSGKVLEARPVDEASFFAANSLDMWQPTGMFGDCDVGMESLRCIRAMGEAWRNKERTNEYTSDFLDPKGDTPWYMSYNMGRLYYSELHAWPDAAQMDPDDVAAKEGLLGRFMKWRVSEAGKIVTETGNQSFFQSIVTPTRLFSPAFQNYDVWLDRFKKEFDPNNVSAPGQPYIYDRMVEELFPEAVSKELEETIKKVAAGPWLGNPE